METARQIVGGIGVGCVAVMMLLKVAGNTGGALIFAMLVGACFLVSLILRGIQKSQQDDGT